MNLKLLTGHEALGCVESEEFQEEWKRLIERCPWATGCQHPGFVVPWYQIYQLRYLPVLVLEKSSDGSLRGLLTLGMRPGGTTLAGAGDVQAEYQAWIAAPGAGSGFIVGAIRELRAAFPGVDLHLKYLPAGIPLDWIDKEERFRKLSVLRSHARPVMKVDEAAMVRQRNKKNHRQNYNRLKRMGDVQFERVVEHDRFLRIVDRLCLQYDFRQAALYHRMPFSHDPLKKLFQVALHKRGVLHTTILTVGGEIAASHSGVLSEARALHVGIFTHDPAYAPHSPGNLLLAMLGVHLVGENLPMLDLTPGGDAYKEHFATAHDSVFELTIHGDRLRRWKTQAGRNLVRVSKTGLRRAGYTTGDVLAALEKLGNFRVYGLCGFSRRLQLRTRSGPCALRYRWSPRAVTTGPMVVSRNRLDDTFKFDPRGASMTPCQFMGSVMKRMERSQHLFSFVQDDKLVLFCWVRMCSGEPASQGGWDAASSEPERAVVLSDLYVHRELRSETLIQGFLEHVLAELSKSRPEATVYYRGNLDAGLRAVVEKCGFVDESS